MWFFTMRSKILFEKLFKYTLIYMSRRKQTNRFLNMHQEAKWNNSNGSLDFEGISGIL